MKLTLILGPMKSGKSTELVRHFLIMEKQGINFKLYQSIENVRDKNIWCRNGAEMRARKVATLKEALDTNIPVIGVDELHMFDRSEADIIKEILRKGTRVIVAGLDRNYQGKVFVLVRRLLDLGPEEVIYLRSRCDICASPDAVHTQVLTGNNPITSGLPESIPDDGTYVYKAVCRDCFVG